MSDTILTLNKATKLYAGVPAIDGVNFDLERGEIIRRCCFIGRCA